MLTIVNKGRRHRKTHANFTLDEVLFKDWFSIEAFHKLMTKSLCWNLRHLNLVKRRSLTELFCTLVQHMG